jgi:hypothetical protein
MLPASTTTQSISPVSEFVLKGGEEREALNHIPSTGLCYILIFLEHEIRVYPH